MKDSSDAEPAALSSHTPISFYSKPNKKSGQNDCDFELGR